MYSEYSLIKKENQVSKNAVISIIVGIFCLIGYVLLIVASILSIGTVGVTGGFFASAFFILSVFGTIWGVLSYDEARTGKRFKKTGIILNVLGMLWGIILFIL